MHEAGDNMNQDWERFGEDIRRTVQDAIDSQDYNRLNQTITNTINNAMGGLDRSFRNVGDAVDSTARRFQEQARQNRKRQRYSHTYSDIPPNTHWNPGMDRGFQGQQYHQPYNQQPQPQQYRQRPGKKTAAYMGRPDLYMKTSGNEAGGIILNIIGGVMGGVMLILLLVFLLGSVARGSIGDDGLIFAIAFGIPLAVGIVLVRAGTSILGSVKRFRGYVTKLGGREYCGIKELADEMGKSPKYIAKDIEKMIRKGWFRQGRLDAQKTCLMVSNDAFRQYTELMGRMEANKREEELKKAQQKAKESNLDPQIKEILDEGDAYIAKIRSCNDAIPGEEISAKISRMEMLVDRIFDRVEQNPETIADIRKLMEYYLPTTVKLLEAYEELDKQPVQGENILTSKREIEKTLDTLNVAFEKLLDSLFRDTAWDVSSDISVLNTMLAQEGLTKEDF